MKEAERLSWKPARNAVGDYIRFWLKKLQDNTTS